MTPRTREEKKVAAMSRARFALSVALQRIDYTLDVTDKEVQAVREGKAVLVLDGDPLVDAAEALQDFGSVKELEA